jgi:membrane protein implicated in regulation of membrane protease activity
MWEHPATLWWLIALGLAALELLTGTIYLLMLALGAVVGALAAHAGLAGSTQAVAASLAGAAATLAWHLKRRQHPAGPPSSEDPDVNLDIGQTVFVQAWTPDRRTRIQYRGSQWSAQCAHSSDPTPGLHLIVAVQANVLFLRPCEPGPAQPEPRNP